MNRRLRAWLVRLARGERLEGSLEAEGRAGAQVEMLAGDSKALVVDRDLVLAGLDREVVGCEASRFQETSARRWE